MGLSNQQYKKAKKIADMNLKSYILYLIPRFFIFPFIFIFLIILVFEGKVELVISLNASIAPRCSSSDRRYVTVWLFVHKVALIQF